MSADAAGTRISACDDLAEDGQVRIHPEVALRTRCPDSEACDDFVEDEQRSVFVGEFFTAADELARDRARTALRTDRLDKDRCRPLSGALISLQLLFQIVILEL